MASTSGLQSHPEEESSSSSRGDNEIKKIDLRGTAFLLFEKKTTSQYIQSLSQKNQDEAMTFLKKTLQNREDDLQKTNDLLQFAVYIANSTVNAPFLTEILNLACGILTVKTRTTRLNVLNHFNLCAEILYECGNTSAWVPGNEECARQVLSNITSMLEKCTAFLRELDVTKEHEDLLMDFYLCKSIFEKKCSKYDDSNQTIEDAIEIYQSQKKRKRLSKFSYTKILYFKALGSDPHKRTSCLRDTFAALFKQYFFFTDYEDVVSLVYRLVGEIATNPLFLDNFDLITFLLRKMTGCRRTLSDLETLSFHLASILLNTSIKDVEKVSHHFNLLKSLKLGSPCKNMLPVVFELMLAVISQNLNMVDDELLMKLILCAVNLCMQYESFNVYKKYSAFSRLLSSTVRITEDTIFVERGLAVISSYYKEIERLDIIENCTWMHERCCHCLIYYGYYYAEKNMFQECSEIAKRFLNISSTYTGETNENLEVAKLTAYYLLAYSLNNPSKHLSGGVDHIHNEISLLEKLLPNHTPQLSSVRFCYDYLQWLSDTSNNACPDKTIPERLQKIIPIYFSKHPY